MFGLADEIIVVTGLVRHCFILPHAELAYMFKLESAGYIFSFRDAKLPFRNLPQKSEKVDVYTPGKL